LRRRVGPGTGLRAPYLLYLTLPQRYSLPRRSPRLIRADEGTTIRVESQGWPPAFTHHGAYSPNTFPPFRGIRSAAHTREVSPCRAPVGYHGRGVVTAKARARSCDNRETISTEKGTRVTHPTNGGSLVRQGVVGDGRQCMNASRTGLAR